MIHRLSVAATIYAAILSHAYAGDGVEEHVRIGRLTMLPLTAESADLADKRAMKSNTKSFAQKVDSSPTVDVRGFYIGGRQGSGTANPTRFSIDDGDTTFKSQYDIGIRGGLIAGYAFGPVLGFVSPRIEVEGNFGILSVTKHNVVQSGINISPGKTDSFGSLQSQTGLLNGFLDINLGQAFGAKRHDWLWRITPFAGGGVGVSQVSLQRQGITDIGVVMDASSTRLTWHASAGVGYQLFDNTTVEVGYRYIRTEGLAFKARDGSTSHTNVTQNLVTIGVRRQF